jgi:palmitoyltransferase
MDRPHCPSFPCRHSWLCNLRIRGASLWQVFRPPCSPLDSNIITVDYLLRTTEARSGSAIVLLVVYFILFLFMTVTYARVIYVVTINPGYLPLGATIKKRYRSNHKQHYSTSRSRAISDRSRFETVGREYASSETTIARDEDVDSPGLEMFYSKEIFVCSQDGRPKWCSECANWKLDRAHHSSDVGRCVAKFDHYCPWHVIP